MGKILAVFGGAGVALLLLIPGAGARPLGDFGRAAPSVLNDTLLPAVGAARARLAGEPVSRFNRTDEEVEMADRIWRFEISASGHDWAFDVAGELQRTRLAPPPGKAFAIDRYYRWLARTPYRSATVRYATLTADIEADVATLPATFAAICRVDAVDRQRALAAANLRGLDPRTQRDVAARQAENDLEVDRFVAALDYRFDSYGYALDQLLVETPNRAARNVDAALAELGPAVRRAARGEFCGTPHSRPHVGNPHPGPELPSRFVHGNPPPEGVPLGS